MAFTPIPRMLVFPRHLVFFLFGEQASNRKNKMAIIVGLIFIFSISMQK